MNETNVIAVCMCRCTNISVFTLRYRSACTTFFFLSSNCAHTSHCDARCLSAAEATAAAEQNKFFFASSKRNDPTTLTTFYLLSFHLCIFTFSFHWDSCFSYYFPPSYFFCNCIPTPISMESIRFVSPTPHRYSFCWWLRFQDTSFYSRCFLLLLVCAPFNPFFEWKFLPLNLLPLFCRCVTHTHLFASSTMLNALHGSGLSSCQDRLRIFSEKKVEEIWNLMCSSGWLGNGKVHNREQQRRDDVTLAFTKNRIVDRLFRANLPWCIRIQEPAYLQQLFT